MTCTRNTVNVALPSVCHQVSRAGTSRSRRSRFARRKSSRSSSHRKMGIESRPDFLGNAQPVVLVRRVDDAVLDFHRQLVELAWRWPAQDLPGLDLEVPRMTGAPEDIRLLVERVVAPEMRAAAVIDSEVLPVLG